MKSKHFEGKIFTNCFRFVKFAKIFPLKNNPLYGIVIQCMLIYDTYMHYIASVVKMYYCFSLINNWIYSNKPPRGIHTYIPHTHIAISYIRIYHLPYQYISHFYSWMINLILRGNAVPCCLVLFII